jgi:hypothetical protein
VGLKVGQELILFRLPLGGVEALEDLVFCYGLESYGVIAPNLGSLRPQVTRQALYSFRELPKAIYLFVSENRIKELDRESIRAFLLQQADAYVFKWNKKSIESRLHARGSVPNYQEERADHYVNSDGGCSWVHDSLSRRALEVEGVYRASAGDLGSGRNLLERCFSRYERDVSSLRNSWIAANEIFQFLPEREGWTPGGLENEIVRLNFLQARTQEDAEIYANFLSERARGNISRGIPEEAYRDKTEIYKPFRLNGQWLEFKDVSSLENNMMGLGHHVERRGMPELLEYERAKETAFFTRAGPQGPHLNWDQAYSNITYPELPMGYFVAGLEAERPHAQALGFYQVLEYEARRHGLGRGSDLAALKNLLMDVELLPHEFLHQAYCTAFPEGDDVYGLKGLKGKIDRGKLGEVIYEVLRNPVVHAGGYGRKDEMAIPPYSLGQFAPSFKQTVCLTRELARHFVAQSGNCAG